MYGSVVEESQINKKSAAPLNPESRATIEFIKMLVKGIEPPTYALRVRCSTPELHQQADIDNKTTKNIITLGLKISTPLAMKKRQASSSLPAQLFLHRLKLLLA